MALILNIDTSINTTYVCIAKDETVLQYYFSDDQKSNASNLHIAIADLLQKENLTPKNLDAVAVTIGPGSYTGLRIGLATAKGLCYALNIPLITIGTLEMMANFAIQENDKEDCLYCPMIDARRMEVFSAIYDKNLHEVQNPQALIIKLQTFAEILVEKKVLFFGNGMEKYKNINVYPNAKFLENVNFYKYLNFISLNKFISHTFANIGYVEPMYVKEFYNP